MDADTKLEARGTRANGNMLQSWTIAMAHKEHGGHNHDPRSWETALSQKRKHGILPKRHKKTEIVTRQKDVYSIFI